MPHGHGARRGLGRRLWRWLFYAVHVSLRGLALLLLLGVLLVVTSYLGLRAAFNEERIRSVFVAQIQDILHLPVQIDKVLLTPGGVKLLGLRVMQRRDMPGQYFLTSDTVLVRVKLAALLRRRLELNQVKLVRPSLQLVRNEVGQWNAAGIFFSSHVAQAMPMGRFSLPMSLGADLTVVSHGIIRVEDRLQGTSYRFDDVNLTVDRFSVDRPFPFVLSCDNESSFSGRSLKSSLEVEGSMSLASCDWPRAFLRARKFSAIVAGVAARGAVAWTGWRPSEIECSVSLPSVGPADWRRLSGREWDLQLPASQWTLQAAFQPPGLLRIQSLRAQTSTFAAREAGDVDFSSATLKTEVSVEGLPLAKVKEAYPAWGGLDLRGVLGGVITVDGPWRLLRLRQGSIRVSRAGGKLKNFRMEGADLSVSASDDLKDMALSVAGGQGVVFARPFADLSLFARLRRDELKVDRLAVRLLGARIALQARLRDLKDLREVAVTGRANRLRWEDAQSFVSDIAAGISTSAGRVASKAAGPWVRIFKYSIPRNFPDTIGHIAIGSVMHKNFTCKNVDMLWDIRGVSPTLKRVQGDAWVSFGPGRVEDLPAVQDANKFLKIIFLPFVYMHKMNNLSVLSAATAYPHSFDFARIEGDYGLSQGIATTRLFYVDSPQMVAFTDGQADFAKETVNLDIMTRLSHYRGKLPEWWVDELGRPAIRFRVKGNLNLPELEPRLSKMASDEIEKAVSRARAMAKQRRSVLDKLRKL